jgi:D-lactate dehydrogenase (cytochrome)
VTALLQHLHALLGDVGLISRTEDMAPYLNEQRGLYQGAAAAVTLPATTEQVQAIVCACTEAGTTIVPQGGNTGLCGGATASPGQVIVNLRRLQRIRGIDPANNTMTVEAGCILSDLQQAALAANRYFPLSLGAEGSCQIGGNLATNAGGVNVLRYGNARDQVLGLEAVLADGRIYSNLTGLRKDNTGYDLNNLLIGSEGTLGIITAAALKLQPRPDQSETALVGLRDLDASLELLDRAQRMSSGLLSSFELIPRIGLEFACRHVAGCADPLAAVYDWYVLLVFSGSGAELDLRAMLERALGQALEDGVAHDATVAASEAQAKGLWRIREGLVEGQEFEGGSIKHDISVTVSRVPELIRRATAGVTARLPGIRPCPFGHVGDGNIHFNLTQPEGADSAEFLTLWGEFNQIVFDIVQDLGGSFSAEHGIGQLKLAQMSHYKNSVDLDLMRAIKDALDPAGVFNPGKVLPLSPPVKPVVDA